MGKHSYIEVVRKVRPYVLLLGVLVLPAAVMSQTGNTTDNTNSNAEFAPTGYGVGGYGMSPAWGSQNDSGGSAGTVPVPGPMAGTMGEAMGRAMSGFMGQMQQAGSYPPGYRSSMGYGPYGASPFDNATGPSPEYKAGGSYGEAGSLPSTPYPTFGGTPFDQGPRVWRNPALSSNSGHAMFHQGPFHRGRGHGSMGCCGMGLGADIPQSLQVPGLSDEQRKKIYDILDKLRRNHWELMGKNMDYSAELRDLYRAERLDAKAIGAVYGKIFDIKRQMIESGIEAKQKAMDLLTDEQRKQLRSYGKRG